MLGEKEACLTINPYQGYQSFTFPLNQSDVKAALTSAEVADLSRVTSIKLKSGIKFRAVTGNLNELSNIEVYLKVATASGVGDQIAYSGTLASGATEVVLQINGTELKQVLTNDMILTVKVLNATTGNTARCYKLSDGAIEASVRK